MVNVLAGLAAVASVSLIGLSFGRARAPMLALVVECSIYYSLRELYDSNMPTLRGAAESFVFAAGFAAGGKLVAPFIRPGLEKIGILKPVPAVKSVAAEAAAIEGGTGIPETVAEAINLAPKLADEFAVAVRTGAKYGAEFKPAVGSVAVDATNTSIVGYGCNSIYHNNPSVVSKVLGSTDEYIAFYRKSLTDTGIDEIVASDPSKFVGKDLNAIKAEMGKLRAAIQKTKDAAATANPPMYYNGNPLEPSFQSSWLVENCAEVWAVRDAILQGAKLENIVLRSVNINTGAVKPFCDNCVRTFSDIIKAME